MSKQRKIIVCLFVCFNGAAQYDVRVDCDK